MHFLKCIRTINQCHIQSILHFLNPFSLVFRIFKVKYLKVFPSTWRICCVYCSLKLVLSYRIKNAWLCEYIYISRYIMYRVTFYVRSLFIKTAATVTRIYYLVSCEPSEI